MREFLQSGKIGALLSRSAGILFVGTAVWLILMPYQLFSWTLASLLHLVGELLRQHSAKTGRRHFRIVLQLSAVVYVGVFLSLATESRWWFLMIPVLGGLVEELLSADVVNITQAKKWFLAGIPTALLVSSMVLTRTPNILLLSQQEAGHLASYAHMSLSPGKEYGGTTSEPDYVIVRQNPAAGTICRSLNAWQNSPFRIKGELWHSLTFELGPVPSVEIDGFSDRGSKVPTQAARPGVGLDRFSRIHGRILNFDPKSDFSDGRLSLRVLIRPDRRIGWWLHDRGIRVWWVQEIPAFKDGEVDGWRRWYSDIWLGDQSYESGSLLTVTAVVLGEGLDRSDKIWPEDFERLRRSGQTLVVKRR